jgi:hypothetical protein
MTSVFAAAGVAAAFAASLTVFVAPIEGARANPPTIEVTVDNPTTDPALTRNVDDPGRIAYQSTAACVLNGPSCSFNFVPVVPKNHRLVSEFRRNAERTLQVMAGERTRTHRRYHLVNDMAESARPIPEKSARIAAQIASLLDEVRERLGRIAALIYDDVHGEREPALSSRELSSALAEFEKWYSERFGAEAADPARPNAQASSAERDPGTFHPLVDF